MNTHYDGNDDHLPVTSDTLEPGDVDQHGNRDTNFEVNKNTVDIEESLEQRPF